MERFTINNYMFTMIFKWVYNKFCLKLWFSDEVPFGDEFDDVWSLSFVQGFLLCCAECWETYRAGSQMGNSTTMRCMAMRVVHKLHIGLCWLGKSESVTDFYTGDSNIQTSAVTVRRCTPLFYCAFYGLLVCWNCVPAVLPWKDEDFIFDRRGNAIGRYFIDSFVR